MWRFRGRLNHRQVWR
ncbi:hypothetical protein YPPY90_2316, partial [Yersinia pestis PY-90]